MPDQPQRPGLGRTARMPLTAKLSLRFRSRTFGTARLPTEFDRRLIAPMIISSVLNSVNSSMIAVALIPIGIALGSPPAEVAWLVSALYLTTSVGQPIVGRLVDVYGSRRLYLLGTGVVGVAGIVGALAPSLGVLIGARVLLGLGTSAAYPTAMQLIRGEADRIGKDSPVGVLTALAVANQTVAVVGPAFGGLLIGIGGWRAIFVVNVPLSALCLGLGFLRLPHAKRLETTARMRNVDLLGMSLFVLMLVPLMLFLMAPRQDGWYVLAIAVIGLVCFAARELRVPEPFVDIRLLGENLPLVVTYVRQLLHYTASYAFLYGFAQWLEQGRGLSAGEAGLVLLPMSASALIASATSGRRGGLYGNLLVGAMVQTASCASLLLVGSGSPVWALLLVGTMMGVPQGLVGLGNQKALYRQAESHRIASAAGLLRTFTYLGALAASVATAAFFEYDADTTGLHGLALFMLTSSVLLLGFTIPDFSLKSKDA